MFSGSSVSFRSKILASLCYLSPAFVLSSKDQILRQFAHTADRAPAALSLKASNEVVDFGLLDGSLACSPGAIVTSTLTPAELGSPTTLIFLGVVWSEESWPAAMEEGE